MPWVQYKTSQPYRPSSIELKIIIGFTIICALVIVYFLIQS